MILIKKFKKILWLYIFMEGDLFQWVQAVIKIILKFGLNKLKEQLFVVWIID